MNRATIFWGMAALALAVSPFAAADDTAFKVESNLRGAVARVDITPPPGTKVVGHVRKVEGVRDPLHAVALLLDDGSTKAAIVTLDLLHCTAGMARQLRGAVAAAAAVPAQNVLVAA